jgi:tetratricopeptide (TPR) repeat protein
VNSLEGKAELANELALFNRVGDLYFKLQKVPEAVDMYERAANLYAEYGFPNNAIALCNKVLRNAPGRTHVYLRLAQLMVERGLTAQAKENLLEYAERMQSAGKTDEAFRALKEFADLSPNNEEIRLLLAEQLKGAARTAEAREQLAKLFAEAEATGDKRRSRQTLLNIKAIDPDFDPTKGPKTKLKQRPQKSADLVFLDLDEEYRTDQAGEAVAEEPEEELAVEPTALVEDEVAPADEAILIEPTARVSDVTAMTDDLGLLDGLEVREAFAGEEETAAPGLEIERTSLVEEEEPAGAPAEAKRAVPPEVSEVEPPATVGAEPPSRTSFEVPDLDLGEFELDAATEVAELELPVVEEAVAEVVPATAAPLEIVAPGPVDIPTLEARVADDPDDPQHHVVLGEALVEAGQRARGLEELDIALGMYEAGEKWKDVARLVTEVLRLEPNSVRHHQKRVEGAFRSGEKREMVQAYLGLANALLRSGASERSEMVFRRVLEYDPDNGEALTAIASLVPKPPAAPPPAPAPAAARDDYVDLGALIFDEETARDTRMRIEDEEPTGDEEKDFADMLSQFKRGIEENIEDEDWRAHYDLGVAFKEMGLVDEAIAEFQKALRAPPGRLRTAEALGSCFFEKKQYSVAATVMRRAVETDPAGDDAKIALLYWLGRCDEEAGRHSDALAWFQRVFALDIRFADVADRVERLAAAGH